MTTATPPRPSATPQPRRQPAQQQARSQATAIDPVKLLKRHKLTLIAATLIGAGLGTVGHFAWLQTWPIWTARVVYQCSTPQTELGSKGTEVGAGYDEELQRFMATQIAIMQSERVLRKAAEDPRLLNEAPKWSQQFTRGGSIDASQATEALMDSVTADILTGTELIELSMWWKDKVDVAGVVNIVNDAYWRDLNYQARQGQNVQKDAVARAIQEIESKIKKLQDQRETTLREAGVDSLDDRVGSLQQQIALATEQRSAILVQSEGLVDELNSLESELKAARGMPAFPDMMRQEVENHPLIGNQKAQIQQMESELTGLRQSGIGPEHRDFKRLQARLDGYNQELQNMRERLLMETFQGRIDGLRQILRQMAAQETDLAERIRVDKARMNDLLRLKNKVDDMQREIELYTESKAEYQSDLTSLEQLGQLPTSSRVTIVESVRVPTEVTFPKIYIMIPLGIILTVGLTAGVILVAEMLDQRVKGPADVAITRTRVLGIVPHASEDPSNPRNLETAFVDHERGVIAESYRQLRASIMKTMRRHDYRSLLVVAGMPGSGSTSVVSNLAHACASADQRVLIIDANLRRPRQHIINGAAEAPGLADVLAGTHALDNAVQRSATGRFDLLSAGSPDQRIFERIATGRMAELLADASGVYDLILIDVAPAVVSGDALELANRVDATCLVTKAYAEKRGMVARLRNELDECRGEFIGVVVNGVKSSAGGYFKRNIRATHKYQNA